MSRYIDAAAMQDKLRELCDKYRVAYGSHYGGFGKEIAEITDKVPAADVQEVVRCKDCVYWQGKKVKMEDGTLRDYTPEEIIEGSMVNISKGINLGSMCLRNQSENENSFPVWCNENDFCSWGEKWIRSERNDTKRNYAKGY